METYFKYDGNRRVYVDPETGERFGGPIYKYSFVEYFIVGETSRSILMYQYLDCRDLEYAKKVPKKDSLKDHGYLTQSQMEDQIWMHDNQYKISESVRGCGSIDKLKAIKQILES
jgi:hypothetical protein